ncbi:ABC1 domain containing protein [Colletotrichum kahawae]|uniref:ABC1 domain containing protein n=1 Tax=Colletotrichum kahawae TaxID=34407 RepID=A0AAD9Y8B6_COLKA|nr:ABC1 domain containing protein [Colletotrichum kahawae]
MATAKSPAKRLHSPDLIPNPFIKKKNLAWSLELPQTQSPNAKPEQADRERSPANAPPAPSGPSSLSAALESGAASHPDPASHFFANLAAHVLAPYPASTPHLAPATAQRALYEGHAGSARGAHFVVHQHDHPVAGTHYDLRLQINATSSVSWAVMYGLPGDANSRRLNRNATETRVHCLWNHVVETGSWHTGSLVVWGWGRYEVLERGQPGPGEDPESGREEEEDGQGEGVSGGGGGMTEQEKLARAFGRRKILVRLHGQRLPRGYVLNLRLTKGEDFEGRRRSEGLLGRSARKRRRRGGPGRGKVVVETSSEGEDEDEESHGVVPDHGAGDGDGDGDGGKGLTGVERELRELEDEGVRMTNA